MNHETRPKTLRAACALLALALLHGGLLVPALADQSQQGPVIHAESGERVGPGPPFTKESLLEALRARAGEKKLVQQIRWRGSSFLPSAA